MPGERIFAVSAMKCTPAKTIVSAEVAAACRDSPSESPTKVRDSLLFAQHAIDVDEDIAARARAAVERMIAIG